MSCLFCKIIDGEIPSYKIFEDDKVICFLDINPSAVGHVLVVPKKHFIDIRDIDLDTLSHINLISKNIVQMLDSAFKPDGFKLVQNNGLPQEIKHYHLHIIPVYDKEINIDIKDVYETLKKS